MNDPVFSPHDPSRRRFIRRSGIVLGGALLHPLASMSNASAQERQTGGSLGVALVGLGSYAMGELAPALRQTKSCRLSGFVTGTPGKAERYGREYGIPDSHIYDYESFDRIADNPDIDIVYVVLPNSMHAEYSIRAARAGKHVLCEKPMAISVAECEEMIAACEEAGVTLNIGYRLHADPYHQVIRRLAAERPYGPVRYVESEFGFSIGNPNQWRLDKELAGGGALMDVGIYCIQAARYSAGVEPVSVQAQEFKTDPAKFSEVDETMTWQLEFPNGAIASSATSYNAGMDRLFASYAENRQRAELSPAYIYRGLRGSAGGEVLDFGRPNQQARHMDMVAESIKNGTPTTFDGQEGMRDMKVIQAIYRSVEAGGIKVAIG